jgi:hypothetical protein
MHKADGVARQAIKFITATYMHLEASRKQLDATGVLFIALSCGGRDVVRSPSAK